CGTLFSTLFPYTTLFRSNGLTPPFFGWVSDQIGRENTMFVAFLLEGIGIYALLLYAHDPLLFVILSGLVFFAWGEIYSLFPATRSEEHTSELQSRVDLV